MNTILNFLLQSKALKAGGIAVGSSGILALILGLIDQKDRSVREFVQIKNVSIMTKITDVERRLDEKLDSNKQLLLRIDQRLYELNKGK